MKVVSIIDVGDTVKAYLEKHSNYVYKARKELCVEDVEDAEVFIGNIPHNLLSRCTKLKFLQLFSAGNEGYIPYLNQGYTICNASGVFGSNIAEHLLMSTLMLFRNMPHYIQSQHRREYKPLLGLKRLSDAKVLVFGTGDLGASYARLMKQFDAKVYGVNRSGKKVACFDAVYSMESLDNLLEEVNVLCFCLPKSKHTDGLFEAKYFELLRNDAIILNVGRSNAIDQNTIVSYLKQGKIAGAMLDVFDEEPIPSESVLWDCPNLMITPHVSGTFSNAETKQLFQDLVQRNMRNYIEENPLENIVDCNTEY